MTHGRRRRSSVGAIAFLALLLPLAGCEGQPRRTPATGPRGNLVINPSFEADGAWETEASVSAAQAHTGTRSLKMSTLSEKVVKNNFTRVQALSDRFPIKPSTRYTLSGWVLIPETFKTSHPDGRLRGAHISLPMFDAAGEAVGQGWMIGAGREMNRSLATDGKWLQIRRHFTTPLGVAAAQVRLGIADVGVAFFDDIALAEAEEVARPSCKVTQPLPLDSPRPVLRDGRWTLRGKPFFPFGFWGSAVKMTADDMRNVKRHHCNIVGLWVDWARRIEEQPTLEVLITAAKANGVYIVLLADTLDRNIRDTAWTEDQARALAAFAARHDNVIGWMLRDDAPCRTEIVDVVHENAARLRRFDPRLPIMVDVIPRRGSIRQAWGEWGGFLDMMCTYVYPVPYRRTLHFEDGLESVQMLTDLVQESTRPPMLWFVVQAHLQDWYRKALAVPGTDHFLSSPDQVRLITYYVIQHGVRGIYFFRYRIELPRFAGGDRMAEIGLMGCEMGVIGSFLAAGERLPGFTIPIEGREGESVEVVSFRLGKETLYLLTRHGRQYQVHVHAEPCRVRLPIGASSKVACLLRWPEPQEMPVRNEGGRAVVEIADLDLTGFVVTSESATSFDALRSAMAERLPDAAEFAVAEAEAMAENFDRVFQSISLAMPADVQADAAHFRNQVKKARGHLAAKRLGAAYTEARAAHRACHTVISRCVRHAREVSPRDKQFIAYRKLMDALVRAKCLDAKTARSLGHAGSYDIPKGMKQGLDPDEPLATVFYTLPRFYGAFAEPSLRDLLIEKAGSSLRKKLGAGKSSAIDEASALLKQGDFASAAKRIEELLR